MGWGQQQGLEPTENALSDAGAQDVVCILVAACLTLGSCTVEASDGSKANGVHMHS